MEIEAGIRIASATTNGKNGHSLISEMKFRQLYALALRLRLASGRDERLLGQEAMAAVAADLRESDRLAAEFASSPADIADTRSPLSLGQRSFEDRVIEAVSDATCDRMRKNGRVTAILFGRDEREEFVQEVRSLAIDAKLPILLVEHQRQAAGGGRSRAKRGKRASLGYPSIPVDARDVIAVYRVAHESIARAREGGGPTHLVRVPWRPAARGRKRVAKTKTPDAIEHLEEWLIAHALPVREWRREIVAEFEARSAARGLGLESTSGGEMGEDDRAIA